MIAQHFRNVEDKRMPGKVKHDLWEIIVMVIVAVAGGCDSWELIADFCMVRQEWLRNHLKLTLKNGVPSHDTMQRVFGMIEPEQFEESFRSWMHAVSEKASNEIVSIDRKTLRGSGNGKNKPLHMVSAWASKNRMVLGQTATDEKSNEITAVPELLELLDISGCMVTADAIQCAQEISGQSKFLCASP